MIIDGVAASEAIDTTGEVLSVAGCDISDFIKGGAPLNWEHKSGDAGTAMDVVGRVLYGRKIFTESDCENERQLGYWRRVGLPFIYVVVRLFDEDGHPGAQAAAAIIRSCKAHNEPIMVRFSIEGSTLERDPRDQTHLKTSVARALAATVKPANRSCFTDVLEDSGSVAKAEHELAAFELGVADPEVPIPLRKALDAAPSSLVGDSALAKAPATEPEAGGKASLLAGVVSKLERISTELRAAAIPDRLWHEGPIIKRFQERGTGHELGRVMILDGQLHHLEDPHRALGRWLPEGPFDEYRASLLHVLEASPQLQVTLDHQPQNDQEAGPPAEQRAQPAEEAPAPPVPAAPAEPPQVFQYRRAGEPRPRILEIDGDHVRVDGRILPESLVRVMMRNVELGAATLKSAALRKKEEAAGVSPAPRRMDPGDALQAIRAAVAAGHVDPDVERTLTQHIYEDQLTPGIGNKYAHARFRERAAADGRPGVWLHMDGNEFKSINDTLGHEAGDDAIRSFGAAAREASDEALGRGPDAGKLFRHPAEQDLYRNGGDEFVMHVPSYEHALRFMHALRGKLAALPPFGGRHRLSMSFGLGHTPEHAERALYMAKEQKLLPGGQKRYAPTHVPNLAHSLVPGREGPIKLHPDTPPLGTVPA